MHPRRSDRTSLAALWVALTSTLGCSSDGLTPPQTTEDAGAPAPLVPGECHGAHTECGPFPEPTPFVDGPDVTCTEIDGGRLEPEWSADLGEVDCIAGTCALQVPNAAVDPEGGIWLLTQAFGPLPLRRLDGQIGNGIVHYARDGKRTLAKLLNVSSPFTRVNDPRDGALGANRTGLLGFGPSRGLIDAIRGVDFWQADASGRHVTTRHLDDSVEQVLGVFASGLFTVAVVYRPIEEGGAPATAFPLPSDLAHLDASGGVLWQRPAAGWGVQAVDDSGQRTLVASGDYVDNHYRGAIASLDENANPTWHRAMPIDTQTQLAVAPDGATYLYTDKGGGEVVTTVQRLNAQGESEWRVAVPSYSNTVLAGIVGESALLVAGTGANDLVLLRVTRDGQRCTTFHVPMPVCPVYEGEEPYGNCGFQNAYAVEPGTFYVTTQIGVARIHVQEAP